MKLNKEQINLIINFFADYVNDCIMSDQDIKYFNNLILQVKDKAEYTLSPVDVKEIEMTLSALIFDCVPIESWQKEEIELFNLFGFKDAIEKLLDDNK